MYGRASFVALELVDGMVALREVLAEALQRRGRLGAALHLRVQVRFGRGEAVRADRQNGRQHRFGLSWQHAFLQSSSQVSFNHA